MTGEMNCFCYYSYSTGHFLCGELTFSLAADVSRRGENCSGSTVVSYPVRPMQWDVGYRQDYMHGGKGLYPLKMPGIVISLERQTDRERQKQRHTHPHTHTHTQTQNGCYEENEGNVSQKPSGISSFHLHHMR